MERPLVAKLSAAERKEVIAWAIQGMENTSPYKSAAVEILRFFDTLVKELQSSNLTISELKRVLLIKTEELKKGLQDQ